MRTAILLSAATLALTAAACSRPADAASGIEVGGKIGTYKATKCGGGIDDGIKVGKALCFT